MTTAYYRTRKRFLPAEGGVYQLAADYSASLRCIRAYKKAARAILRNEASGWTVMAHGVGIYADGRIDWDYSTGGRFT